MNVNGLSSYPRMFKHHYKPAKMRSFRAEGIHNALSVYRT